MKTPSGIMTGTYRMVDEKGSVFDAEIPVFSLDFALRPRVLNWPRGSAISRDNEMCAGRRKILMIYQRPGCPLCWRDDDAPNSTRPHLLEPMMSASSVRRNSVSDGSPGADLLDRLIRFDTESSKSNLPLIAEVEDYVGSRRRLCRKSPTRPATRRPSSPRSAEGRRRRRALRPYRRGAGRGAGLDQRSLHAARGDGAALRTRRLRHERLRRHLPGDGPRVPGRRR